MGKKVLTKEEKRKRKNTLQQERRKAKKEGTYLPKVKATAQELKDRQKEYRDRPENKAKTKKKRDAYYKANKKLIADRTKSRRSTPEWKEKHKEYLNKDEVKNRIKQRNNRPDVKEKVKKQKSLPEVKERLIRNDKERYRKNRDEILVKAKVRYENNRDKILLQKKDYYSRPEVKSKVKERVNKRFREDVQYKLSIRGRNRRWQVLKFQSAKKQVSYEDSLGCTIEFFKQYIESLFKPGMTWENHGNGEGKWNLDEIKPCASFDLSDPEQYKACFHYSNCQPLWWRDNVKKSSWHEGVKHSHKNKKNNNYGEKE